MNETSSAVRIRDAGESDAPQVARLLQSLVREGWFSALGDMVPEEIETNVRRQLRDLARSGESSTWVVEIPEGPIAGYCSVHWLTDLFLPAPEGYLSDLFLLPDYRGQGIGRLLLDRVVAEAEVRGAHRLMLLNGRHRESYQRDFYAKNGWEERDWMANFVYWVDKA